jgi:hypothetical protein
VAQVPGDIGGLIVKGQAKVLPKVEFLFVSLHGQAVPDPPAGGRFQKWFSKLKRLGLLNDGWDSYKAPKPNWIAIINAELYLKTLESLAWEPTRVEPSVMGGVGITHRQGSRKVYVEFYNDGTVHALFSDRSGESPNMETTPIEAGLSSFFRFIGKAREYLDG